MARFYPTCRHCPYRIHSPYAIASSLGCANRAPVAVSTDIIKYESKYIDVELRIPVLSSSEYSYAVNKLNQSIRNDIIEFKEQMEAAAVKAAQEAQKTGKEYTRYVISTIYEVTFNKNAVVSISIIYYEFIEGKNYYIKTSYNYNLNTGQPLSLKNLFMPGVDYISLINREIREELAQNKEKYFPGALQKFKGISEDQPFYIDSDSLNIYFGFHQIAPTALQIPIITIPYSELGSALKPVFLS
ncbi:MAG: DUF3298 and DUF4163 domain-containing protein [Bacillota bacterium]